MHADGGTGSRGTRGMGSVAERSRGCIRSKGSVSDQGECIRSRECIGSREVYQVKGSVSWIKGNVAERSERHRGNVAERYGSREMWQKDIGKGKCGRKIWVKGNVAERWEMWQKDMDKGKCGMSRGVYQVKGSVSGQGECGRRTRGTGSKAKGQVETKQNKEKCGDQNRDKRMRGVAVGQGE